MEASRHFVRLIFLVLIVAVLAILFIDRVEYNQGLNFEKTADGNGYIVTKYVGEDNDVTIPDIYQGLPVVAIGDSAFAGYTNLETIVLPESIQLIDKNAFSGCTKLLDIKIPSGVKVIRENAFSGCEYLTYIYLPDTLQVLGDSAFADCPRIKEIHIEEANTVYTAKDNCLIEKESKTLVLGCQNSVIPEDGSVTTIGYAAFYGSKFIEEIKLSSHITKVGAYAFSGCYGLKSVKVSASVQEIGEYAFNGCTALDAVYYEGTLMQWNEISVLDYNYHFNGANIYCESEI